MRAYRSVVLSLATLAACHDGVSPIPGSSLHITAPSVEVVEGSTLALGARIGDRDVDPAQIDWESRDPSTVTVQRGVVRGVAPGVAYVVARNGSARDSVRLSVRFAHLDRPVALRVAGLTQGIQLGGAATFWSAAGGTGTTGSTIIYASDEPVVASSRDAFRGDTVIRLVLHSRGAPGAFTLGPTDVRIENGEFGIANDGPFLNIRVSGSKLLFYVAVTSSRLDILEAEFPAAPGRTPGRLRGAIAFEAAGFEYDGERPPSSRVRPLGDTTVMVYAEFQAPYFHVLAPVATASLAGPAYTGALEVGGYAVEADGGASMRLFGFYGDTGSEFVIDGRLWIPSPGAGGAPIAAVGPEVAGDSTGGSAPWMHATRLQLGDGMALPPTDSLFSRGGAVTVTEYTPPTRTGFGLLKGQLTVTLGVWAGGVFTGETTTLTAQFVMPVFPLDGRP